MAEDAVKEYLDLLDSQRTGVFAALNDLNEEQVWQQPLPNEWCVGEILSHTVRFWDSFMPGLRLMWRLFGWYGRLRRERPYRVEIENVYKRPNFPMWSGFLWTPRHNPQRPIPWAELTGEVETTHSQIRAFFTDKDPDVLGHIHAYDPAIGVVNLITGLKVGIDHDQLHYDDLFEMAASVQAGERSRGGARLVTKKPDLKVFITTREASCGECGEDLGRRAWITLVEDKGALCLSCADLDHLVFLPAGDAALTRRSRKHSTLSAVVLRWSRARKRYERQGLLVEVDALEQAEQECLADEEARARRRERAAASRAELDREYVRQFAERVRQLYPRCPPGREVAIAEHACLKYSGRVGRSAAAKSLDEQAIRLAVVAHVRHAETPYDSLLARNYDRWDARAQVKGAVARVVDKWEAPA